MLARVMPKLLWVAVFAGCLLATPAVRAQDKPKDLDKIPKAVMDALKARFPKADIHKWTKETEDGKELYDIEFKQGDQKFEADISEDGTIQNWEKEIGVKELPAAVTKSVEQRYPKSKIEEVMQVTDVKDKKDVPVGFEIVLKTADGKDAEVTVAADGKILEDSGLKP